MKSVAELEAEHRAWADSQQVVSRCSADGCDWTFEGTAADGRQAHAEHRSKYHPELKPRARRTRVQPFYEKSQAAQAGRAAARAEARSAVGERRNGRPARARKWTPETIVAAIQQFHAEHGRAPKSSDWAKGSGGRYPMLYVVRDVFGTWNAAIEAAGFEPRRVGGPKNSGAAGAVTPSPHHAQGAERPPAPVSAPEHHPEPELTREPSFHGPVARHVADTVGLAGIREMLAHAEKRAEHARLEIRQAHNEILTLLAAAAILLERRKAA